MTEGTVDAKNFHLLGRLHQRLGHIASARRAYMRALSLNPSLPRTFNNLALLELNQLDDAASDKWLQQGLALKGLDLDEADLLHATGCDLRLFQLQHQEALNFVERQLQLRESVMALCNKAVCLQKLTRLDEALKVQAKAIELHLKKHAPHLFGMDFRSLIGMPCGELEASMQLQVNLMNMGIFKLCKDPFDKEGLQLLLAGTSNDHGFWLDSRRGSSLWKGEEVQELILWDDQGYGDSIQNLGWVRDAAKRVKKLQLWLRPSLLSLVRECFRLPKNCSLETMNAAAEPWSSSSKQLGLFFLPMVLESWNVSGLSSQRPGFVKSSAYRKQSDAPRIGLVWSAGRHSAPQPERSARVRDVPFPELWEFALQWKDIYRAELFSLQLDGNEYSPVKEAIESGNLRIALTSTDWLSTSQVLETLDLLVSVDTSVAHLAGALGIPCFLLLSNPSDWRWGQYERRTLIYESFQLARCETPGDWNSPLQEVNEWVGSMFSS